MKGDRTPKTVNDKYISKSNFTFFFQDLAETRPFNSPVQISRNNNESFVVVCHERTIYFDISLRPEEYRFFTDIEKYCFAKNYEYDLYIDDDDLATAGVTIEKEFERASGFLEYLFELVYGVSDQHLFHLNYCAGEVADYDEDSLLIENSLPEEDPSLLDDEAAKYTGKKRFLSRLIQWTFRSFISIGIICGVSLIVIAIRALLILSGIID